MIPVTRDGLIVAWQQVKQELEIAKEKEAKLRKAILNSEFNFEAKQDSEGTENVDLGLGYKLKATFKLNRKLDTENLEKVLRKMEKTGQAGALLAERLVKFKPELSITEYKKLPENFRAMIDEVIVTSPAMPTLQLIEPKAKK